MRSFRLLALALPVLLIGPAFAQERPEKPEASAEVPPNSAEVTFTDGSVVRVVLLHDNLEVVTRFGKLNVGTRDIRRVEVGLRTPEGTLKQIEDAIARLSNANARVRDAAVRALLDFGESAIAPVQQAARGKDAEVARKAQEVLKALDSKFPADSRRKGYDVIATVDFPIHGRIVLPSLKVQTPYFGEVQLQLTHVRRIRWLANDLETRVSIDGGRYGLAQEAWLDSGVEVSAGMVLEVRASGTIDMYPPESGTYMATPDGSNAPNLRAFGGFGGGRGGPRGPRYTPGALLGRIGPRGRTFVVGSMHESTPQEDGKLYLRIAPGPWSGVAPRGDYEVNIAIGGR